MKKYFYVLRPLLATKWILDQKMAPKIQVFNDYIEQTLPEIKSVAESMEGNKVDWLPLNELFLRVVRK